MKYTTKDVDLKYQQNLDQAYRALCGIDVARGRPPKFKGLNGWVFEQTIRSCLEDEFEGHLGSIVIEDQVSLKGRVSVDLLIGRAAIEIKSRGLFADESEKYSRYREYAKAKGYEYLYLTLQEEYTPYAKAAILAFGENDTFFLNEEGSWRGFVKRIAEINHLLIS